MRLTPVVQLVAFSLSAFVFAQESPRVITLRQQIQAANGQLSVALPLARPSRRAPLDRRKLVEELIRTSPASVRKIALPPAIVQALIAQDPTLSPVLEIPGERTLRNSGRLLCVAIIFIVLNGCGGGSSGGSGGSGGTSSSAAAGTQAGSYRLAITATATVNSQSISHNTQITLTVN